MTLYEVKKSLGDHIGENVHIRYSLGRNKYEEYIAIIKELYDYIFVVENETGIKSFSYNDVMMRAIKIDY